MNDIFVSYNWGIKAEVRKLCDLLEAQNYTVWQDDKELSGGNRPLTSELASAIKSSKVFLCCITKEYCKSYNCNLEVEYANAKKKPMISLMIENIYQNNIYKINKIID